MKSLRHFATSPLRHFATSPLRHASHLVTLVLLALASTTANAALIVNVEGVRGSGKTTWTLSGSSSADFSANIRTSAGSNGFLWGDTTRIESFRQSFSDKTTIGRNSLFAVKGLAQVTVGSQTQTITHIFLSPNIFFGDEFGIRVNTSLPYTKGASSRWSGRFTLDLDISNFKLGSYNSDGFGFSGTDVTFNFKETTSVPDPSSLALLGLALTGLGFSRKLTSVRAKA